jgi:hypothetical protein
MTAGYSLSLITLLKGILYNHQKMAWENLLQYEPEVKKYFSSIGLDVYIDKSEGYAYLQQSDPEDESGLPRLAEKRQLNFFISLLCIVLRKYLLEQDAQGGSTRAIISRQEIIQRARSFLPQAADEAKQQDKILTTVNKVIDMGFLRELEDDANSYEVHRIIKGFVNAEVIDDTLGRLERYATEKNITD